MRKGACPALIGPWPVPLPGRGPMAWRGRGDWSLELGSWAASLTHSPASPPLWEQAALGQLEEQGEKGVQEIKGTCPEGQQPQSSSNCASSPQTKAGQTQIRSIQELCPGQSSPSTQDGLQGRHGKSCEASSCQQLYFTPSICRLLY